jgi:hypothetical protein
MSKKKFRLKLVIILYCSFINYQLGIRLALYMLALKNNQER